MEQVFNTKPNGIPVLSADRISQLAEQRVRRLQPELFSGQMDAVDLKLVLQSLEGWRYAGKYLSASGYLLGVAVFKEGTMTVVDETRVLQTRLRVPARTILVDKGLYQKKLEPMFRFTLGHEIGHALLHEAFCSSDENMRIYAEQGKEKILRDSAITFAHQDSHELTNERDWVEWQANAFSSALLMPKSLVFRTAALVENRDSYVRLPPEDPAFAEFLNELCITLSDVFRVSPTAAFYRMKSLGIAPPESKLLPNGAIV